MTEDMMAEQETILARLGTSEEAGRVRAKMQSGSLLSDMQAFKVVDQLLYFRAVIIIWPERDENKIKCLANLHLMNRHNLCL